MLPVFLRGRAAAAWTLLFTSVARGALAADAAADVPDLTPLSIEELANLEITSVSKKAEPVSGAPAAVYVITPDEIRRFGAITIPEALALAPNLTVRQFDPLNYAISARGFDTIEASNKLLALIDGRSIYSSLHSGVFWGNSDLMLDDVARIEVVGGPGGTLWGANAVNGVINMITKSSRDTQGWLVGLEGGSQEDLAEARYGGRINDGLTYRIYAKGLHRDGFNTIGGVDVKNGFSDVQGGSRSDWEGEADQATLQGDVIHGESSSTAGASLDGGNALLHWIHVGDAGVTSLQAYIDTVRTTSPGVKENTLTTDVDLQHNLTFGLNDVVVGGGYRSVTDKFLNAVVFSFVQPKRTIDLANAFAQDTIHLTDSLRFIAGVKLEHNDFTGWEVMPNGRIAWQPSNGLLLWGAVSRAVRTPSRIDRELQGPGILAASPNFRSEQLTAYEAGLRAQAGPRLSFSVSTYYDVYQDIRDTGFSAGGALPVRYENAHYGHIYGVEAWGTFTATEWWRLEAGINALHKAFHLKAGRIAAFQYQSLGNDPDYDATVRSAFSLGPNVDASLAFHVTDSLTDPVVPAYAEMSARLAWRPVGNLELSLQGNNLLHDHHGETGTLPGRQVIPRSIMAGLRWVY